MAFPDIGNLFDSVSGAFSSVNINFVGIGIGAIIIIALIFWGFGSYRRYRAYHSKWREKQDENEAGMRSLRRKLWNAWKFSKRRAKNVHALYKWLRQRAAIDRAGASKAEIAEGKGAALGARASEEFEESTEALAAIEGRALGLIAELKLVEQAVEKYVQRENFEDTKQEQEAHYLNQLAAEIGQLNNFERIDERVLYWMQNFLANIVGYLEGEIGIEEEKVNDMKELISKLKRAAEVIKDVLNEARTGTGIFRKYERKARADYSGSIRQLRKAIRKKIVELVKARMVRGADKAIVGSLKREIGLMMEQYSVISKLNNQLSITYEMMEKEIKETKMIIRRILNLDREIMRLGLLLAAIEPQIERKIKQMRQSIAKIKAFESYPSRNIYAIALGIASDLNAFVKETADAGMAAAGFDDDVRKITKIGVQMASLTVAYERTIRGLADAEQAVDDGMKVLTRMMQGILIDPQMKIDEQEVEITLDQLRKQLDYESTIDRYLSNIEKGIRYKLGVVYSLVDQLVAEDMRVVNSMKLSSASLGQMVAIQVNHKVSIDEKYFGEVRQFEQDLKKRNADAYNRYVQARRAQAFAVA